MEYIDRIEGGNNSTIKIGSFLLLEHQKDINKGNRRVENINQIDIRDIQLFIFIIRYYAHKISWTLS